MLEATGLDDRCPVVSEPFHEWVLSGAFPGGRPRWEDAGATFTDDITPFEHRKLWLLNGAHSLLAYAGSIRGHTTVAEAVADETCRSWLEEWWAVASPHLDQPAADVAAYRAALLSASPTRGCTTGWTGSPPTARRSSRSGSCPSCAPSARRGGCPLGATRVLAAWVCHLRGLGAPVSDVRADEVVPARRRARCAERCRACWAGWTRQLGADADVVAAVVDQSEQLSEPSRDDPGPPAQVIDRAGRGHDRRQGGRVRAGLELAHVSRSASTRCCSPRPTRRSRTPQRS